MSVSACGVGDWTDPEHLKCCLMCNGAAWREYRRNHPGRVRRFTRLLIALIPEPRVPPESPR